MNTLYRISCCNYLLWAQITKLASDADTIILYPLIGWSVGCLVGLVSYRGTCSVLILLISLLYPLCLVLYLLYLLYNDIYPGGSRSHCCTMFCSQSPDLPALPAVPCSVARLPIPLLYLRYHVLKQGSKYSCCTCCTKFRTYAPDLSAVPHFDPRLLISLMYLLYHALYIGSKSSCCPCCTILFIAYNNLPAVLAVPCYVPRLPAVPAVPCSLLRLIISLKYLLYYVLCLGSNSPYVTVVPCYVLRLPISLLYLSAIYFALLVLAIIMATEYKGSNDVFD